ncbi:MULTISPECIES: Lrp/AsnC family transcriptional regulator [Streptomyces]|uniref:Lrp/AsnC family transcriptional regulator n=1 Tax=Streptomyces TaxID=1883 RepID=UPI00163BD1DF|nr:MULTISPECIES: AsnC family transcriptional regulator [Streptomyces]MBC2876426.1 AsnC family transcriptional regulator [Streptomyces sp. TYQ1024]UBI35363.1 Lrp/AsnC family transcriptional regulator [Streptomyces mobaraensis]UKW27954.1 Lrp/AsnC family transcriptional regulator [Streptomyces sp. TYQ1024]
MDSLTLDEIDHRLVHELQRDGRAPFSRLAEVLGVSEHTVARRYRRLHTLGLRVVGVPGRRPSAGATRWLLRVHCTPDASAKIADALARRPDTAWVGIASAGTELHCAVETRTTRERDALLLDKLPQTPRVGPVHAYHLLHAFSGAADAWHIPDPTPTTRATDDRQEEPPQPAPDARTPDALDEQLIGELAKDGRATVSRLAQGTGRSPAAVARRLDRLRATAALRLAVDFVPELLGYHLLVRFWLRVAPGRLGTVGAALAAHPEIPFAAATTGPSNLVATGMFHDTDELYRYLDHRIGALPGVQSIETTPILREVKRLTYNNASR